MLFRSLALARPDGRRVLAPVLGAAEAWLLAVVVAHMLLSSELGRMGYLFAPVFTAALALVVQAVLRGLGTQARAL